ncbi:hypothetical protein LTV02_30010 [Nocardia yamanashiensis]|uniref:hypothetical protein n=1 Tax=Nocardia yamanashiensis TaxID=209247 RepID=UPI001E500A93|nr:hypothetical protein [Nocardia yamanashiensis]UGT40236.1 hypothetical protein LTV02_30010 [Nocardia yamanashiensis]
MSDDGTTAVSVRRARGFTAIPAGLIAFFGALIPLLMIFATSVDANTRGLPWATEYSGIVIGGVIYLAVLLVGGVMLLLHLRAGRYLLLGITGASLLFILLALLRGFEMDRITTMFIVFHAVIATLTALPSTGRWVATGEAAERG